MTNVKTPLINILAISLLSGLLQACGSSDTDNSMNSELETHFEASKLINEAARKGIYTSILNDERFPDSFYTEPENNSNLFYTIKHISNHDMLIYDSIFSYPLCENDFSAALQKANAEALNTNTSLVNNSDNAIYYEFSRQHNNNSNSIYIQRIYKCTTYTANANNSYKGHYNPPDIDMHDYLDFIEYRWYFSFNNNFGNIVLFHQVSENNNNIKATITNARIDTYGVCDTVSIIENHYNLDITSREIIQYEVVLDSFSAKTVNNTVELCS